VAPLPAETSLVSFHPKRPLSVTAAAEPGQAVFASLDRGALVHCFPAVTGEWPPEWAIALATALLAAALTALCAGCVWFARKRRGERGAMRELSKPAVGPGAELNYGIGSSSQPQSTLSENATDNDTWEGDLSKPARLEQRIFVDDESSSDEDVVSVLPPPAAPGRNSPRDEHGPVGDVEQDGSAPHGRGAPPNPNMDPPLVVTGSPTFTSSSSPTSNRGTL
jgi:hypothetical protein